MSGQSGNPAKASVSTSKASLASVSQISPALSQTQQFFSGGDASTRRSGSGNLAARPTPTPRSSQSAKPKHKQGKRFRALDEDAEAETFSMQNPHGRRGQQSITHLMQFSLPPRPTAQQHHYHRHNHSGSRRNARSNPTWGLGSGYHAVDKARYIHANYRFIVDPRGDYQAQAQDADVHLDWNHVLQIIASSKTQTASCPICLGEPTAPRMAKCGHIFCLPCLIRYMHSEDAGNPAPEKKARWKKCPICWDSIYVSETRPVRWYAGQESSPVREGSDMVLRLVKRKPASTLAMPRESAEAVAKGDDIPWYFAAEVMDYARVMKGSEEYMLQQYDETLAAIELQEREDELMFGEDTQWTGRAIRMLKEAKEKIKGIGDPPAQPQKPEQAPLKVEPPRPPIEWNDSSEGVPDMYLQRHADIPATITPAPSDPEDQTASSETPTVANAVPRTLHEMRQRHTEKPQPSEYFFYHGLLHYYLSPLDIRILKSAFGSYSAFPSSILPRVERVASGHVVDDEFRKRVKYLSHLPYGCEVAFLECDWKDVVSASVLEEFRPMLERRRRRNDEKDAREEKERLRIEREEEKELAHLRQRRRPSIPETDAFFSSPLPTPMHPTTIDGAASSSPPSWGGASGGGARSGFMPLASPSTSPTVARTVWGTAAVAPASPDLHASLPRDDELRDDGWLQGWETDLLDQHHQHLHQQQQDAAVAASLEGLERLDLNGKSAAGSAGVGGGGGGGGKKGKKSKKIMLMSTANGRRGA